MSTTKNKEFDYQAYMKENPPDPTKITRGKEARQKRLEAARKKLTIRIDKDILNRFQQLTPEGQGHEELINQALREWLSARDMKALLRDGLQQIVQQAVSSAHKEEAIP